MRPVLLLLVLLLPVLALPFADARAQATGEMPDGEATGETPDGGASARLRAAVDARVELVGVVFRLAGSPEYEAERLPAYVDAVERHFGAHRRHAAVRHARVLAATYGIGYERVVRFALHLTPPPDLRLRPTGTGLGGGWTRARARAFAADLRAFAAEADAAAFFDAQAPRYAAAARRMQARLDATVDAAWLAGFTGLPSADTTRVVVGLGLGPHSYAVRFTHPDGTTEHHAVMGAATPDAAGRAAFDAARAPDLAATVIHELAHGVVNPLVDAHLYALRRAGPAVFAAVAGVMRRQGYGRWEAVQYESLVRAVVGRYVRAQQGDAAAEAYLAAQHARGFVWLAALDARLARYASDRARYPTLAVFMPRVVEHMRAVADDAAGDAADGHGGG